MLVLVFFNAVDRGRNEGGEHVLSKLQFDLVCSALCVAQVWCIICLDQPCATVSVEQEIDAEDCVPLMANTITMVMVTVMVTVTVAVTVRVLEREMANDAAVHSAVARWHGSWRTAGGQQAVCGMRHATCCMTV